MAEHGNGTAPVPTLRQQLLRLQLEVLAQLLREGTDETP